MNHFQSEDELQKGFSLNNEKLNPVTFQEQAYERLRVLYSVSKMLTSLDKIEKKFPEVLNVCATTFPFLTAIIMENKSEKFNTIVWNAENASREQIELAIHHAKESFIYLTATKSPNSDDIRMKDIQSEQMEGMNTEEKSESKMKNNYCVVPLVVDQLPSFGILQIEASLDITENDLEFVGALGDLIAISVDRHHKTKLAEDLHKSEVHTSSKKLAHSQIHVRELEMERELRERFVSLLTHDLRTPLSAIKMTAQLLQRHNEKGESVQLYAERINNSVNRADQMISDLLDANRIRSGEKLPMNVEEFDLSLLLKKTLEELAMVHGDRFIFKSDQEVVGFWDPKGIRRILENLCNNAIKYGLPEGKVTVTLLKKNKEAVIQVHNRGEVISHEDQKILFKQFSRGKETKVKGWGIGLTLVRGVAEAHGGRVKVESEVETGTVFTVIIPIDSRPFIGK